MDRNKLNDIYEYFLGETEKASEKDHMYELLKLLITKETEF